MSDTVTVLLFAAVREVVGASELTVSIDASTTAASLLDGLCVRTPALRAYVASLRVAVNGAYAAPGDAIRAGDEVAIIPPVAGG